MGVRDRNIDWRRQLYRIPWTDFHRVPATDVLMAATDEVPAEMSTFGVGGIVSTSNGMTAATIDLGLLPIMDFTKEVGVRVLWAIIGAGTSATDDILWVATYELYPAGSAMGAIDTALTTAIPTQENMAATQYMLCRGARGIIAANTITESHRADALGIQIALSTTGFAAGEVSFLGVEIDYYPQLCCTPTEAKEDLAGLEVTG